MGVGTGGRLLVFVALAQVKSLASCRLGLVGVASLVHSQAPCGLIGLWGAVLAFLVRLRAFIEHPVCS